MLKPHIEKPRARIEQEHPAERGSKRRKEKRDPKAEFKSTGEQNIRSANEAREENPERERNDLQHDADLHAVEQGAPNTWFAKSLRATMFGSLGGSLQVRSTRRMGN